MKIYKLECVNEDGQKEENGYFLHKENAEIFKREMDTWRMNSKYGIEQHIIEIETED